MNLLVLLCGILVGAILYYFLTKTSDSEDLDDGVVFVYADWCPHCKSMLPHVRAAKRRARTNIRIIEGDSNPRMAKKLKVRAYPTTVIVKNKKVVKKIEGARGKKEVDKIVKDAEKEIKKKTIKKTIKRKAKK